MENAREELKSLKSLMNVIKVLKLEIKTRRIDLELPTGLRYDKVRVQTSSEDTLAERIDAIREKERQLKSLLLSSELKRKQIIARICQLKDARHVELLMKVYIDQEPLDQAAADMGYSLDHAKRLHSAAVKAYETALKK